MSGSRRKWFGWALGVTVLALTPASGGASAITAPSASRSLVAATKVVSSPIESVWVMRKSPGVLKVRWSEVPGVDAYRVLKRAPGSKRFAVVARVSGSRRAWVDKLASEMRVSRYRVQGCVGGVCGSLSRSVSAVANGAGAERINVGRIDYESHTPAYGLLEQFDLHARALPGVRAAAGRGKRPVSKRLRYLSLDPTVASVSATGQVSAGRIGSTSIRVIAHNGRQVRIPVAVQNYAYPGVLNTTGVALDFWNEQGAHMSDLVNLALEQRLAWSGGGDSVDLELDDDGNLTSTAPLPTEALDLANAILTEYWLPGRITIGRISVHFRLVDYDKNAYYTVSYLVKTSDTAQVAPHWTVNAGPMSVSRTRRSEVD